MDVKWEVSFICKEWRDKRGSLGVFCTNTESERSNMVRIAFSLTLWSVGKWIGELHQKSSGQLEILPQMLEITSEYPFQAM